jgi:hypothetical protein
MSTNFALIGLTASLIMATACWYLLPLRAPKSAARHRLMPNSPNDATAWLDATNHNAPLHPFSRLEAHAAWQQHSGCPKSECARKAAAIDTLIDAGVITPRKR